MGAPKKAQRKVVVAKKPQVHEVTAIARFENPWAGDEHGEMEAIRAGKWHPSMVDFDAVANTPNQLLKSTQTHIAEVTTIGTLAGALIKMRRKKDFVDRPDGVVKRLNIISHGMPGLIALAGKLDKSGACYLGDATLERENGALKPYKRTQIDDGALSWLAGEDPEDQTGKELLDKMRAKFTHEGAEIWLILCRGGGGVSDLGVGAGAILARKLRDVFRVKVIAFATDIWYWPDMGKHITSRNVTSIGERGERGLGYPSLVEAYYTDHGQKRRLGWHMNGSIKEFPAPSPAPAKK